MIVHVICDGLCYEKPLQVDAEYTVIVYLRKNIELVYQSIAGVCGAYLLCFCCSSHQYGPFQCVGIF